MPIKESAPHIYLSALAFSPSFSAVKSHYSAMFQNAPTVVKGEEYWWSSTIVLEGHRHWVNSVSFSPDGKHIVSGSYDKTIQIWDAQTRELVAGPFEGHQHWVSSFSFPPNANHTLSHFNTQLVQKLYQQLTKCTKFSFSSIDCSRVCEYSSPQSNSNFSLLSILFRYPSMVGYYPQIIGTCCGFPQHIDRQNLHQVHVLFSLEMPPLKLIYHTLFMDICGSSAFYTLYSTNINPLGCSHFLCCQRPNIPR